MEIKQCSINNIRPYNQNAKSHPKKQIEKIANSIVAFGFNQPIVVDKDGVIIVGHGRYFAAMSLNMVEVPVLEVNLDDEKTKAYRLADNKLNESEWDMDLVIDELKNMSMEMVDLTGFDKNLVLECEEDFPDLEDIGVPKSKLGDVYWLGQHRLICGDSTSSETYEKLLDGEKARMIFTDPPYSINYEAVNKKRKADKIGKSTKGMYQGTGGKIFNDDKTPEEAVKFYVDVLTQFKTFSTDDVTLYWWYAIRLMDVNMKAWKDAGWHYSQVVMWLKNGLIFTPSHLYHKIYEPCIVGWKEGKSHYQNRTFTSFTELWTLGGKKKFSEYLDAWYQKIDATNSYIHPTQKPVQLAERAIKRSTQEKDIVLDAFGGSGSTLIACDQLNRQARIIELDPKYIDAIVSRWVKFVDDPTIVKNGKTEQWIT